MTAAPRTRRRCRSAGRPASCIDATEFGRRIAFEDLPTAGAFMVFDASRDMFEVARNFAHFFAHESCGFCTPCRVGTSMLVAAMDKIHAGNGTQHDLREMNRLNRVLLMSAHCGLGHTACNPILDTLKRFRPAYERKLRSLDFTPAFDLDGALGRARQMTGRDDAGAHLEDAAMNERPTFLLDGAEVPFEPGQTVMQAALAAGRYIPHLCYHPEFKPHGSCKLCTVKVNGRTDGRLHHAGRDRDGGRERHARSSTSCGARWCRCCSSRATTSAPPARRAATACCRPSATISG